MKEWRDFVKSDAGEPQREDHKRLQLLSHLQAFAIFQLVSVYKLFPLLLFFSSLSQMFFSISTDFSSRKENNYIRTFVISNQLIVLALDF